MDGPVTERDLALTRRETLLEPLFVDRRLWRGPCAASGTTRGIASGIPSGHAVLDAVLPDGGFPAAALTEIYVPSVEPLAGIGELALVLPALARLARGSRLITFIAPPELPYAPALVAAGIDLDRLVVVRARDARDVAWATEQALRDGSCVAVVAWLQHSLLAGLRRLQLAAEAGECWGVLYRPWPTRRASSPAALRLALAPTAAGLRIEVLKCRGSNTRTTVEVALADAFAPGAAGRVTRPSTERV